MKMLSETHLWTRKEQCELNGYLQTVQFREVTTWGVRLSSVDCEIVITFLQSY